VTYFLPNVFAKASEVRLYTEISGESVFDEKKNPWLAGVKRGPVNLIAFDYCCSNLTEHLKVQRILSTRCDVLP
jgi:hypothetical protein